MSPARVTVTDYGMGNLLSLERALSACGAEVLVTDKPEEIRRAERLVIPGVGAFRDGMQELQQRGLHDAVRDFAKSGSPLLGICLGMQMLFELSEEHGEHRGLGILPGRVKLIPSQIDDGHKRKVPHVGWSAINCTPLREDWSGTLLEGIEQQAAVYFVHSYAAHPDDARARLADSDYVGFNVAAAVQRDNIMGCQFHPEKSGRIGLTIIRNFCLL